MKALVVFSGGLDSTTVLARCIKDFGKENVYAISFFYGQRHRRELESVLKIIRHYGIDEHTHLFMPDVTGSFVYTKNPLLDVNGNIPEGTYREQGDAPITEVPFRNGIFLSIAAGVAMANGIDFVYCGIHQDDDRAAYADTSVEFFDLMRFAISSGTHRKVMLRAPFVNRSKADIVIEGLELKAPLHLSWSCYKGGEKPCGKCATCLQRAEAFKQAGAKDPALETGE